MVGMNYPIACASCALEKDQGSSPPSHKVGYGSSTLGWAGGVRSRRK